MRGDVSFPPRRTGSISRGVCVLMGSVHLLVLAGSTYLAATEIKSILTTGWICSLTGVLCGLAGLWSQRFEIAVAGFATLGIALVLWGLEAVVLNLGPERAMLPFCIVFFINSLASTVAILVGFRLLFAPREAMKLQLSLSTAMAAMTVLAVFMGIARSLTFLGHSLLMTIALGLAGLTTLGLGVTLFAVLAAAKKRAA